jgi:hypothetical protein
MDNMYAYGNIPGGSMPYNMGARSQEQQLAAGTYREEGDTA